ncbi:MAG: hypothetical protein RIQ46_898 [Pseudomonadota bacterium]|jgi:hypothetical protein
MKTVLSRVATRMLIAAAVIGGLSVPAVAAPRGGAFIATLAAPLAEAKREIVGGKVWKCEGDRCVAPFDGGHGVRTCAAVAQKFGTVATFTTPRGALTPEDLAACNGG